MKISVLWIPSGPPRKFSPPSGEFRPFTITFDCQSASLNHFICCRSFVNPIHGISTLAGHPPHLKAEETRRSTQMMQSLTVWDPPEFNMVFFVYVSGSLYCLVYKRHGFTLLVPSFLDTDTTPQFNPYCFNCWGISTPLSSCSRTSASRLKPSLS